MIIFISYTLKSDLDGFCEVHSQIKNNLMPIIIIRKFHTATTPPIRYTGVGESYNNIIYKIPELQNSLSLIRTKLEYNSKSNLNSERYKIEDVDIIISELELLMEFLLIVKSGYTKKYLNEVINDITKYFEYFGIDNNTIKYILNKNITDFDLNILNKIENNSIENYINEVKDIVNKKNVELADKVINRIINPLLIIENIQNVKINNMINQFKIELLKDLVSDSKEKTIVKGRRKRVKP